MKRFLLLAALCGSGFLFSQTTIMTEDFDSYTAGSTIVTEAGAPWETWLGGAGTSEDAFIDGSVSSSGSNSLNCYNTAPGAYLHDVVWVFPMNYTNGTYELKMKYYIPSGFGAYFNLGGAWFSGGTGYEYGVDLYFNADGSAFTNAPGTGVFSFTNDTWFDISCMVDMSSNNVEVFIDGSSVFNGAWGAGGFGVIDIFGFAYADASGTGEGVGNFFVDDMELIEHVAFDVGIGEEAENIELRVFPNPSNGQFEINFNGTEPGNYDLVITDVIGNTIHAENLELGSNNTLNYDLELASGLYTVTLTDGAEKLTKKFSIQ